MAVMVAPNNAPPITAPMRFPIQESEFIRTDGWVVRVSWVAFRSGRVDVWGSICVVEYLLQSPMSFSGSIKVEKLHIINAMSSLALLSIERLDDKMVNITPIRLLYFSLHLVMFTVQKLLHEELKFKVCTKSSFMQLISWYSLNSFNDS